MLLMGNNCIVLTINALSSALFVPYTVLSFGLDLLDNERRYSRYKRKRLNDSYGAGVKVRK